MGEYLSRFTFYDVMGYLMPGLLALCATLLGASAIDPAWTFPPVSGGGQWFMLIVTAYFTGHAVQGLTYRLFPRSALRSQIARSASTAVLTVVARALEHHDLKAGDAIAQFAALDALKAEFEDREVFVARQGFFRGSTLAFGFTGLVLLASFVFDRHPSVFGFAPDRPLSGVCGAAGIGVAVLFFFRYRDFLRHEFEYAAAAIVRDHKPAKTGNYLKTE